MDINKMFQNLSSAPSSTPSSDSSSPSMRNVPLPSQQASSQSTHAPSSQLATPPSALATARIISDIYTIQYPEGVSSPRPHLNVGAKAGKFRYDRDFLLQFMMVCKAKPPMLSPLDSLGLEPNDQISMTRGGSGRHRQGSGAVPSRQGSIGLGFSPGTFGGKGSTNPFSMENFSNRESLSRMLGSRAAWPAETAVKQALNNKSDPEVVTEFLDRLLHAGMCSTALLYANPKDTVASIIHDFSAYAPEALEKLSLMIKGAGLEDNRWNDTHSPADSSRQGSIDLGFSPRTFGGKESTNPFSMGNFGTAGASKLSSEDRFAMSAAAGSRGDLSNFGKISKAQPMTFGPSSVFAGKKGGAESKRESLSRTSSNSNMFSTLSSQAAETAEAAAKPAELTQRRRLVLQPRSKRVEAETADTHLPADGSYAGSDAAGSEIEAAPEMTEAEAKKKIAEDVKEFFAVRNLEEAEVYFTSIPSSHHHLLVDTVVTKAVESKEADAKLVADFFAQTVAKNGCSAASFEAGLMPTAEIIDDIAIDAPKAFQLFAMMIKGAGLDETRRTNLASKSLDSEKLLARIQ